MKNNSRTKVLIILIAIVVMAFSSFLNRHRISAYKEQNNKLKQQIEVLKKENDSLNSKKSTLDKQFNEVKTKLNKLKQL